MTNQDNIRLYLQQQQKDAYNNLIAIQRQSPNQLHPKRYLATELEQAADNFLLGRRDGPRWFVITGLRGVGKTTVLAQVYTHLKQTQSQVQFNQLYISLDDIVGKVDVSLAQILDGYQNLLASSWIQNPYPTFIFIDEIQVDPLWARTIKAVYDKSDNIFFICTGSSAADLQIDADVAGRRARLKRLHPLNFGEYQLLSQGVPLPLKLKPQLLEASYYSPTAKAAFEALKKLQRKVDQQWSQYDRHSLNSYLTTGSLPFGLSYGSGAIIYDDLNKLIDRVISHDLTKLHRFGSESLAVVRRLLFLLATAGDVVSFNKLTQGLKTNTRQLWLMLDALQKAGLIIKVPAYGSHFTTTKKPARYHFMSPALRAALYNVVGNPAVELIRRGSLLEDAAVLHYYRELVLERRAELNYPYDKQSKRCDFILKFPGSHQLAIEFGVGSKGSSQVTQTMSRIDCRYGLKFSDGALSLDRDLSIVSVPLDYFFLM